MKVACFVRLAAVLTLLEACGARDGLPGSISTVGGTGAGASGTTGSGSGGTGTISTGLGGQTQVAPAPQLCGPNSATCRASEYCSHPLGNCRSTADFGFCVARPVGCSSRYIRVCACDGQVYDNSCVAQASGADISISGSCDPDALLATGWLPCGGLSAVNAELAYCEIGRSVRDRVAEFSVYSLPPACVAQAASANPSCSCFPKDTPCLEGCSVVRAGNHWAYTLVCERPR